MSIGDSVVLSTLQGSLQISVISITSKAVTSGAGGSSINLATVNGYIITFFGFFEGSNGNLYRAQSLQPSTPSLRDGFSCGVVILTNAGANTFQFLPSDEGSHGTTNITMYGLVGTREIQ